MYPGFFGFWKQRHHHGEEAHCGDERACGPRGGFGPGHRPFGPGGPGGPPDWDTDGGGFGVRRPLRFLAWKLELEEHQVAKLAVLLDELKTERAQAAVDQRRSIAAFADGVESEVFDLARATEAAEQRVRTAERLKQAVLKALQAMHALLTPEQRKRLAYLLRTGALSI